MIISKSNNNYYVLISLMHIVWNITKHCLRHEVIIPTELLRFLSKLVKLIQLWELLMRLIQITDFQKS